MGGVSSIKGHRHHLATSSRDVPYQLTHQLMPTAASFATSWVTTSCSPFFFKSEFGNKRGCCICVTFASGAVSLVERPLHEYVRFFYGERLQCVVFCDL